jgi:hypothetical protein
VVLYIADADNIFQSRKDPRLSAEQYQTLAVYLKMLDGTLIRKNGKCLVIMDANHVEGIDDATRVGSLTKSSSSRASSGPAEFAELLRRGLLPLALADDDSDDDWQTLGEYLLSSALSNREIGHVIKKLRRSFELPDDLFELSFSEQRAYRNQQLQNLTLEIIRQQFSDYVRNRAWSSLARTRRDSRSTAMRVLHFLARHGDE